MATGKSTRSTANALPSVPPDIELPESPGLPGNEHFPSLRTRWIPCGTGIAVALEAAAFLIFGLIAFRENLGGTILCAAVFGFIIAGALGEACNAGLSGRKERAASSR